MVCTGETFSMPRSKGSTGSYRIFMGHIIQLSDIWRQMLFGSRTDLCQPQRPRDREHEHFVRARTRQRPRAGGDGRAGGEDVVNEQDAFVLNQTRSSHLKGARDAFPPRPLIHPGAMPLCVGGADKTRFVERKAG